MGVSLIAQLVNNLPAVQETQVWFLGQEDPLEKEVATLSSILAWRIPWPEEPGRLYSPWGHKTNGIEHLFMFKYWPLLYPLIWDIIDITLYYFQVIM